MMLDEVRVMRAKKAMRKALEDETHSPWEEMGKPDQESWDAIFDACIKAAFQELTQGEEHWHVSR